MRFVPPDGGLGLLCMKVSLNWLRDYIHTDKSAEEIARDFTFGGISVLGLTIDKVFVSGFLSFVVISATIYFLNKFINWVFSK